MQKIREHKDGTARVVMSETDYENLLQQAPDFEKELALRLGAEVGLRASEIAEVKTQDIKPSTEVDADFLRVRGKDTTGQTQNGKYREAYLPERVESLLTRYARSNDIPSSETVLPSKRTVQRWITNMAEDAADETGIDEFNDLSAHDLRAFFATQCLVEKKMNVRVVMRVGGWQSYQAIKPYLGYPSDATVHDEFQAGF